MGAVVVAGAAGATLLGCAAAAAATALAGPAGLARATS
jgi:hypothetical protein